MSGLRFFSSYLIVGSMNSIKPERWQSDKEFNTYVKPYLGRSVAFVRKTSEVTDPALRTVFLDHGSQWIYPWVWDYIGYNWGLGWPALAEQSHGGLPIPHMHGTCLSFADGHAEYWKWKDPATVKLAEEAMESWRSGKFPPSPYPQPAPPNEDYLRLGKAIWGKAYPTGVFRSPS